MKGARATMKNSLVLSLSVLLIFGLVFLDSCKRKPGAEEAAPGAQPTDQARIEELQRELNSKNDLIKQLQRENADLQNKVPTAWGVQEGDNHWKIAYSYLTDKKGLSDEEAKKVLKSAYLFDTLLTGFQVGNVSDGAEYSGLSGHHEAGSRHEGQDDDDQERNGSAPEDERLERGKGREIQRNRHRFRIQAELGLLLCCDQGQHEGFRKNRHRQYGLQ